MLPRSLGGSLRCSLTLNHDDALCVCVQWEDKPLSRRRIEQLLAGHMAHRVRGVGPPGEGSARRCPPARPAMHMAWGEGFPQVPLVPCIRILLYCYSFPKAAAAPWCACCHAAGVPAHPLTPTHSASLFRLLWLAVRDDDCASAAPAARTAGSAAAPHLPAPAPWHPAQRARQAAAAPGAAANRGGCLQLPAPLSHCAPLPAAAG